MATDFQISDVVNVIISSADRPLQTTDFQSVLLIGLHNVTPLVTEPDDDNILEFNNLDAVSASGFISGNPIFDMCSLIYGGDFPPKKIILKRATVSAYYLDIYAANSTVYSLNIKFRSANGTWSTVPITFTSDSTATANEIATGLAAAINGAVNLFGSCSASASGGNLIITPSASGGAYRGGTYPVIVSPTSANIGWALGQGASSSAVTHYNEVKTVRNDFFFVLTTFKDNNNPLVLAQTVESDNKMCIIGSPQTAIWSSSTSDLASNLKAASLSKTMLIANKNNIAPLTTYYPEASLVGSWAGTVPGKNIIFGKTLKGILQSSFTPAELTYVKNKNANAYINRGGLGWLEDGKMASGSFADVVRGSIWLEVTMEEDIFAFIKRKADLNQKIPYTDAGIQMVVSVMEKRLNIAVKNEFLSSYKIFAPLVENIATADKTNRLLPDLPFEARLAGAFQNVVIRGVLSV